MSGREELLGLAEQCEQATGADRELDQAIGDLLWQDQTDEQPRNVFDCYQAYSSSLDAAMMLIPEGHNFSVDRVGSVCGAVVNKTPLSKTAHVVDRCSTAALALTAAALRARAGAL